MRKLSEQERQLLQHLDDVGGSYCPGADISRSIPSPGRKSIAWIVSKGFMSEEMTDDGPRWHLTAQGRAEVDHG